MSGGEEVVGLDYWLRWQVFACAGIVFAPTAAAVSVVARARGRDDARLRQSDLWTLCWRGVHPLWLLVYRAFAVPTMCWLLYQDVLIQRQAFAFYFYTEWTLALVIIYFVIATLISAHGCWIHSRKQVTRNEEAYKLLKDGHGNLTFKTNKICGISPPSDKDPQVYEKEAGTLGYVMQIAYQTSAGAVMLTDIVFWLLLVQASANFSAHLLMAFSHYLNAVFLLLDTALNSLPFPYFRKAYFVFWSVTYMIFQWVMHACGFTWWPYPFLDLGSPWAPLTYIGIALFHIPCYGSYWLIVKAKHALFPKFFPHAYIGSF